MEAKLSGMGVVLITPFKTDESVDFEALRRLVDYQIKSGTDYLVVLGTNAETATLTEEEKDEITNFVVGYTNGRLPIVLGVGGNNTRVVVEKLKNGNFQGISAILSTVPYYNKPSQEGIYQHYRAIAEASKLPVILYNVPGRTVVNMTAETTLRLAVDFPKKIVAVKEASGDLNQMSHILSKKPKDFHVISGDDSLTFPLIAIGGIGVMSVIGNAFPAEFSKMVRLAIAGDYAGAREIHLRFTELIDLLFVDGSPAGVKCMLSMMGYLENKLRLPLVPTRIATMDKIKSVLDSLNVKY